MIDFAALALGPALTAFGRPVTVTPPASRPPRPAFAATGVWGVRNVDVGLIEGESLNSLTITLGIRLADWPVAPVQGMRVNVPAAGSLAAEGTHWVDRVNTDGQGGASLILKKQPPGM